MNHAHTPRSFVDHYFMFTWIICHTCVVSLETFVGIVKLFNLEGSLILFLSRVSIYNMLFINIFRIQWEIILKIFHRMTSLVYLSIVVDADSTPTTSVTPYLISNVYFITFCSSNAYFPFIYSKREPITVGIIINVFCFCNWICMGVIVTFRCEI